MIVSKVGRQLYDKFFKNYTRKQWGLDASELDAAVTARVPVRSNRDDRYFTDRYQAMPLHGYTRMFERMLTHPNIKVMLNTDYREIENIIPFSEMIYTGPVDEYLRFRFGKLPYRSLEFRFETFDVPAFQDAAVVNYPNENPTRGVQSSNISPVRNTRRRAWCTSTRKRTAIRIIRYRGPRMRRSIGITRHWPNEPPVHFLGRLATYKYYNMDQVVGQSLALFKKLVGSRRAQPVAQSA